MKYLVFLGLMGVPALGAAQELSFSPAATEACLAQDTDDARTRITCIGLSANACMADTPGGATTVGMGGCLDAERAYWDARLNTAYAALMALEEGIDAEMAEIGATVPSRADALRAMQRAWIPYRDAACDYERAQWGNGTGAGPATLACLMQVTGEQALKLSSILDNK